MVVTGGAGALAGRPLGLRGGGPGLAGLEIALRDLDDLAGNARRVVAAVDELRRGELGDEVPVHVELPRRRADRPAGWPPPTRSPPPSSG